MTDPTSLILSAVALLAPAALHMWWSRRQGHAPAESDTGTDTGSDRSCGDTGADPGIDTGTPHTAGTAGTGTTGTGTTGTGTTEQAEPGPTALWRMRTTVRDEPGTLAALCTALAGRRVDILSLQTHPLATGTVDEFLLRAPAEHGAAELTRAVSAAGGSGTWIERADAHDLVDAPTRMLNLATRTALDAAELPLALRQLLGRCTIRSIPAESPARTEDVPVEGMLDGTLMRLRAQSGGVIAVERAYLPFTPTEFARARALVELDARLGPRVPGGEDVLSLQEGPDIVRRADGDDLEAAKAMHERCSKRTLSMRYHGPVVDADRYLGHLLSPRFGRTLTVQTPSGRLIALGHLLWDGDETEVALLVEDDWQRRGIGTELLGRLVAMAVEAGCESVYAVTQSSNTAMVAAMRGLGLPLDYQIEEGTLVVTARLSVVPAAVDRSAAPS
ncbi:GNAT family N-acetyltransferase [Streptomyces sp. B-S-A8]|uniref:GNAT family N-acetyltransferase n=1 Tax=Streptomyces solicavernae TaxID=3043614 RepID=A0ABT6RUD5_9ACTN|nr:GNAT family N-acetyltransferase [Streptomyces sp. B-S-A8]MDI3388054.1 GNAT family N-acetyltransferase [Streptomyces sp. B-S-A8]